MVFTSRALTALAAAALLAGCATRSVDVQPEPADPAEFLSWSCTRMDDELDRVQQRAADVAWAVDERAGNNIMALGVGVAVFWPAILAMRPAGLEASELAQLKGRYDALRIASERQACPPASLPPERLATWPVSRGERLVYEDRSSARQPPSTWVLRVREVRRNEVEFVTESRDGAVWLQDQAGNVLRAPDGALLWQRLLRQDLALGQVLAGEILVAGDPLARARVRGQVVAIGPQMVAARRFDAAVVELFGDSQIGDSFTRLDGALVVDRSSGVLLRLDLRSAHALFSTQRRLMRVENAD